MSKLGIIFCAVATVFFVSASAGPSNRIDKNHVTDEIDNARDIITKYIITIRDYLRTVSPDHDIQKIDGVIREFQENITKEYESARPIIEYMINNATTSFDKTNCNSFINNYKVKTNEVRNILDVLYIKSFEKATLPIGAELQTDFDTLDDLKELRNQAESCSKQQCNDIQAKVQTILSVFDDRTSEIFHIYRTWFKEPTVRQVILSDPKYNEMLEMRRNLFENTMNCLIKKPSP